MFLTLSNHVNLIFNYYCNVIYRIIIFIPTREVFIKPIPHAIENQNSDKFHN